MITEAYVKNQQYHVLFIYRSSVVLIFNDACILEGQKVGKNIEGSVVVEEVNLRLWSVRHLWFRKASCFNK